MPADARPWRPRTPPMASLRVPTDPSPHGIALNAFLAWRLARQGRDATDPESGNAAEEYRSVCEFMRLYATLRFYQLALLLGTTGGIVGTLAAHGGSGNFPQGTFLRGGGLLVSLALLVMEYRASSHWHRLRARGNALARALRFQGFPPSSRWNPLSTSGASFYLHGAVGLLWLVSLVLHLPR